jgi:hypothetical protein
MGDWAPRTPGAGGSAQEGAAPTASPGQAVAVRVPPGPGLGATATARARLLARCRARAGRDA